MRIFSIMFVSLLLSACSTPTVRPPVQLYPITHVSSSSVGNQQPIFITAVDARNLNSYSTANINQSQNVSHIMTAEMSKGLQKQGFIPVNAATNQQDQITVTLKNMDYRALSGYMSKNTETFVTADVTATNASGASFTKTYNASVYNDSYMSLSAQTPSAQVNQAFDKLLNNILNDSSLIQFLAKP